jgi:hypothetical protein
LRKLFTPLSTENANIARSRIQLPVLEGRLTPHRTSGAFDPSSFKTGQCGPPLTFQFYVLDAVLPMRFLMFDLSEAGEGVTALEAMASTCSEQHAEVMAEVQEVLDWAWRRFPMTHGPVDDGNDWDHDLQVTVEEGRWFAVTLTLTGSQSFVTEFIAAFGDPQA